MARVLHNDAESSVSDLVVNVSENPYARLVKRDDGIDTLRWPQLECADVAGCWNRIAVECHDREAVPRQRNAMSEGGIRVENTEHDALALLNAHRLPGSQRMRVDGITPIDDVERALASARRAQISLPSMECEEDLGVVASWIVARLDVEKPKLSGIRRAPEISTR